MPDGILQLVLLGVLGIGFALLTLRHPHLLVALSVYTLSLDYLGRVGGSFITLNNLLKAYLIVVFLLHMAQSGRKLIIPRHLAWFLPFLVFLGLSSFYSPDLPRAGFFVTRITTVWIFAVIVANLVERTSHLALVFGVMVLTALTVSITAHMQTLNVLTMAGVEMVQKLGPDAGSVRALGTFWDANSLGGFLGILSLYMICMLAIPKASRWIKVGILLVLFVTFGAVLLSYSRSAWILVGLGIAAFWRFRPLRPFVGLFFAMGALGVLYLIFMTPYGPVLMNRLMSVTELTQDYSGRFRWFLAYSGMEIWAGGMRWLWGGGFYSFSHLIWSNWHPLATNDMVFHSGTHLSHTLLITLLAEGGLIGTGLFGVFLFAVVKELIRIGRKGLAGLPRIAFVASSVVIFVKIIDTFLNPSMYDNLFWLTLGLIGALVRFPAGDSDAAVAGSPVTTHTQSQE